LRRPHAPPVAAGQSFGGIDGAPPCNRALFCMKKETSPPARHQASPLMKERGDEPTPETDITGAIVMPCRRERRRERERVFEVSRESNEKLLHPSRQKCCQSAKGASRERNPRNWKMDSPLDDALAWYSPLRGAQQRGRQRGASTITTDYTLRSALHPRSARVVVAARTRVRVRARVARAAAPCGTIYIHC